MVASPRQCTCLQRPKHFISAPLFHSFRFFHTNFNWWFFTEAITSLLKSPTFLFSSERSSWSEQLDYLYFSSEHLSPLKSLFHLSYLMFGSSFFLHKQLLSPSFSCSVVGIHQLTSSFLLFRSGPLPEFHFLGQILVCAYTNYCHLLLLLLLFECGSWLFFDGCFYSHP